MVTDDKIIGPVFLAIGGGLAVWAAYQWIKMLRHLQKRNWDFNDEFGPEIYEGEEPGGKRLTPQQTFETGLPFIFVMGLIFAIAGIGVMTGVLTGH